MEILLVDPYLLGHPYLLSSRGNSDCEPERAREPPGRSNTQIRIFHSFPSEGGSAPQAPDRT